MTTLKEAIKARHSVRRYVSRALSPEIIKTLQDKIDECNKLGNLNIQLVVGETRAFSGLAAYGKFSGVENYFVMVAKKGDDCDERIGYYGQQLVLLAQSLGLNTCWAGISYRKVANAYEVGKDEKLVCMISLGYGETQGPEAKHKPIEQISNCCDNSPQWFKDAVKAVQLAPTAINQQKFYFELLPQQSNGLPVVKAHRLFSIVGYTKMDLGIAKLHFEIGADAQKFVWAK